MVLCYLLASSGGSRLSDSDSVDGRTLGELCQEEEVVQPTRSAFGNMELTFNWKSVSLIMIQLIRPLGKCCSSAYIQQQYTAHQFYTPLAKFIIGELI